MTQFEQPTIVLVPGLRGEVPEHWQERMAAEHPRAVHLPTPGRQQASLADRVATLECVVASVDGPVVLVAHSAGVLVTVHWAARYGTRVEGALLATPPTLAAPLPGEYPSLEQLAAEGWLPIPRTMLPFPSLVVASRDDVLGPIGQVTELAGDWGSELVDLGPVGHLNPASGFGAWRWAEALLDRLPMTAGHAAGEGRPERVAEPS